MANFESDTGYAWDFIARLYAGISDKLASELDSMVAYPRLTEVPPVLRDSAAELIELEVDFSGPGGTWRLARFIRRNRVVALYLPDRITWHPAYAIFRLAGVRWIVVHEHSSGARRAPTGSRRLAKSLTRGLLGMLADRVITVSDYVRRRVRDVDLVPSERVVRVWNSVPLPESPERKAKEFRTEHALGTSRPLIITAGRLTREKGFHHLFHAFRELLNMSASAEPRPLLLCMGDGPMRRELDDLVDALRLEDDVRMLGYVPNAGPVMGAARFCVVPSVWEEAFGLSALEPLACGVPVIASRTGGIPEVVDHGRTGLLVPPGDRSALAAAMKTLLDDPELCEQMGRRGRARVREDFSFDRTVTALAEIVAEGLPARDRSVTP